MKIYTKTGDTGATGLIGGWVEKDHPRVEAYGTLDELNAFLGLAIAHLTDDLYADIADALRQIQRELFVCGADLAMLQATSAAFQITATHVEALEQLIDRYEQELSPLKGFILPGGSHAAAILHICRTVCRRAERLVVTVSREETPVNPEVLRYLNRLSDLCFVLARVCNAIASVPDLALEQSEQSS